MTRLLSILLLVCSAVFAQIQDIPGTEAVGASRQKIVDNFNYLNAGKAVATVGTVLPATCAYNAAGPVVLFVNTTGPTLSVCSAPNVWTQVAGNGSVTWGQLLGTLSNQADLAAVLAGKAALTHASTHENGGADEIATATAAANAIPKAGASGKLDIGWVPTGQTGTTVAAGNDARFTDARTPTAHAGTHLSNGSDALAAATTTVRGTVTTTTANSQAVSTDDSRMTNTRTPTAHAASHQNGGSDEIATATAAANAIPKAGASGSLAAGWIPDLSGTYTRAADKTGSGSKIASAASVPPDGCANWAGGNLGSTGSACGTGTGGITDLVQDLTPQLGGDVDMNGHNIQTVTPTEMTYLHGVTSAIQTQLGGKVASSDPRLSDARTPTAHAGTHLSNGSDAMAAATTTVRGTVTTTTANSQAVSTDDSRMTNARTPTAHVASHQNGGSDEIATATAAANAIPKAGTGSKLDIGWFPTGQTGTTVALGNDARFTDARTPTAHAGTHLSNGSDALAAATTTVRGTVTTTTANSQAVSTDDSRMTNARTPTAHAASHQNAGADEIATATAAANAIPKAGSGGKLGQAWIDFSGYQPSLGYTAENQTNKSANTALGTSDTLYPTQNAVKTYVDSHAGSGIVNQTTGVVDPSGNCSAPSPGNLTIYTNTNTQELWFCSASATWKKILSTNNTGAYVESGAAGPAPANPTAGQVVCYFDSVAKTQICLDENGNAFVGVKGQASRDANKFVTHITPLGIPQTAQLQAADVPATPLTAGTSVTLTAPRGYYVCTGTCSVTLPAPSAGYEFCVFNDDNVTAAITFQAAAGISYEKPDHSGYGTISTGTLASTAGTWSKACVIGRDSTRWLVTSTTGTWTAN